MTDEIAPDELDWGRAEVREGRPAGAVVSVRLDAQEVARLHALAATLELTVSQVLRRALAAYDDPNAGLRERRRWLIPHTYGGVTPAIAPEWHTVRSAQVQFEAGEKIVREAPTETGPVRIDQRVTVY